MSKDLDKLANTIKIQSFVIVVLLVGLIVMALTVVGR